MFCPKCGTQFDGSFCPKCGAAVNVQAPKGGSPRTCSKCGTVYQGNFCPNGCNSPYKNTTPVKKGLKGWQIALIVVGAVLVFFVFVGIIAGSGDSSGTTQTANNSVATSSVSDVGTEEKETETNSESAGDESENVVEESSSQMTLDEELATYATIDFATLARNPDNYKGQNFKFTGEVIQVQEPMWGDTVELRVNVTKETYEYIDDVTWTDTIYATVKIPDGEDRILENDIITFYGECKGLYSYTSVLGSTVSLPKIEIKYWNLSE